MYFSEINTIIHNVSLIKIGKKFSVHYFDMTLQLKNETRRAICFGNKHPHDKLQKYVLDKSPVKLKNLKRTLNKQFNVPEYHLTKQTEEPDAPVLQISAVYHGRHRNISIIAFLELSDCPMITNHQSSTASLLIKKRLKQMMNLQPSCS